MIELEQDFTRMINVSGRDLVVTLGVSDGKVKRHRVKDGAVMEIETAYTQKRKGAGPSTWLPSILDGMFSEENIPLFVKELAPELEEPEDDSKEAKAAFEKAVKEAASKTAENVKKVKAKLKAKRDALALADEAPESKIMRLEAELAAQKAVAKAK